MSQAQKQEFIGGLIASVLVKEGVPIIKEAVTKGLKKVASKPDNKVTEADVPKAVPVVIKEVREEMAKETQARAEHQLDAEDHWRSRNIWGSFVGLITAVNTLYIFWMDDRAQSWEEWSIPIGIIIASVTPLYSRFIAKKPLFK